VCEDGFDDFDFGDDGEIYLTKPWPNGVRPGEEKNHPNQMNLKIESQLLLHILKENFGMKKALLDLSKTINLLHKY